MLEKKYLCQQIKLKKLSQTGNGNFLLKVKVSIVVYHQKTCQKSIESSLISVTENPSKEEFCLFQIIRVQTKEIFFIIERNFIAKMV